MATGDELGPWLLRGGAFMFRISQFVGLAPFKPGQGNELSTSLPATAWSSFLASTMILGFAYYEGVELHLSVFLMVFQFVNRGLILLTSLVSLLLAPLQRRLMSQLFTQLSQVDLVLLEDPQEVYAYQRSIALGQFVAAVVALLACCIHHISYKIPNSECATIQSNVNIFVLYTAYSINWVMTWQFVNIALALSNRINIIASQLDGPDAYSQTPLILYKRTFTPPDNESSSSNTNMSGGAGKATQLPNAQELHTLHVLAEKLLDAGKTLNQLYGLQLFLDGMSAAVDCSQSLYGSLWALGDDIHDTLQGLLLAIVSLGRLYFVHHTCQVLVWSTGICVTKLLKLMLVLSPGSRELSETESFCRTLTVRGMVFTAYGMYNIDMKTFSACCNMIFTYVIIALGMSNPRKP